LFYKCPKNLRVHLCDIRLLLSLPNDLNPTEKNIISKNLNLFTFCLDFGSQYIALTKKNFVSFLDYFQNFLFDKKSPHYYENVFGLLLKICKIQKQLDHIQNPKFKKIITDYYKKQREQCVFNLKTDFKNIKKDFLRQLQNLQYQNTLFFTSDTARFQQFCNELISYFCYIMDLYLLGRLLRQFHDKTITKTCIVYVGDFNAFHYRQVLKLLGAKCVYKNPSIIKIGNNKNQFFSSYNDFDSCVELPLKTTLSTTSKK